MFDVIRDGMTHSLMMKWQSCRQAARFYVNGVRPETLSSKIQLGLIFHELLEDFYGVLGQSSKQVFGSVAQKWRDKTIEKGGDLQAVESLLAQAHALFEEYITHWMKDDVKKKWIQVESVFDVKWEGWRLRGRCDGIYEDKKGKLWLLETKTKSRIPSSLDSSLAFDPQNLLYLLAKEQELGRPIIGVLYNVIRQPSLRQKQTETAGQFFDRICEDIKGRPEHYFIRYELRYTKKQRKVFAEQLAEKLADVHAWNVGDLPTYRSECSCSRGWNCEFIDLCATDSMAGYREDGTLFSELED